MIPPANLLAWRERRLKSRLRFWQLIMGGTLCAGLMWAGVGTLCGRQETLRHRLLADRDRAFVSHIVSLSAQTRASQQTLAERQDRARRYRLRQEKTRRWSDALNALAQAMPDRAWLTVVDVQAEKMRVEGVARDIACIDALEKAGLKLISQGALQRQNSGEWRFTMIFSTEFDRASLP
jgi:Tfp pilus assembly protein PilN